jgi:hypothetical protein
VILNVVCDLYGSAIPYRKKKDGQPGNGFKDRSFIHMFVMVAAFAASFFFAVNVVYIILASAAVGIFLEVVKHRKEQAK